MNAPTPGSGARPETFAAAVHARGLARTGSNARLTTLLELIWAVGEITPEEDEVVATVLHMIRSGAVQLRPGIK